MRALILPAAMTLFTFAMDMPAGADVVPVASVAEAPPDATIRFTEGRLSAGIDRMWGRGKLSARYGDLRFSISGAPMSTRNTLTLAASGKVYHLDQPSDFAGTYVLSRASDASSDVHAESSMTNEHGVVIRFRVTSAYGTEIPTGGKVFIQLMSG
jgi:hypothetical protein